MYLGKYLVACLFLARCTSGIPGDHLSSYFPSLCRLCCMVGDTNCSEAAESIKTACFTTEILEGFDVQRTIGLVDTLKKYVYLTEAITQYYKSEYSEEQRSHAGSCPCFGEVIKSMEEPKGPEFSINGAYLIRFDYTETNHTLSYKLPLNITLTNPYKDPFELIDTQNAVVQGWKPMVFEEPLLLNTTRLYSIDVVIAFKDKNHEIGGEVMCNLNVPLSFNETSCNGYKPTKCIQVFLEYVRSKH
ncbi:unnamed protein product [Prunus armeniaca]|uniref:Crossover junction endonuclease MUS81 n=1 Tax=Prunus armeniaca TaxID=36596 RepID=A0A6J5WI28_PRUAR|nr:unnamed protein product [Prunus armeniaca]